MWNTGISNGLYSKLFSVSHNSYNVLTIYMMLYFGYIGFCPVVLQIRFIPSGFSVNESRIEFSTRLLQNYVFVTKDDSNTCTLWVQSYGIASRVGYEIISVADESNVFYNGSTLTDKWTFPASFTTQSEKPTDCGIPKVLGYDSSTLTVESNMPTTFGVWFNTGTRV